MTRTGGLVKKLFSCGAKSFPRDDHNLTEGHIWVCVGVDEETWRFELEVNFLNHPLFEQLLRLSIDEFGYSYDGALRIACEAELFLHLLHLLRSSNPSVHYMNFQPLMDSFYTATAAAK